MESAGAAVLAAGLEIVVEAGVLAVTHQSGLGRLDALVSFHIESAKRIVEVGDPSVLGVVRQLVHGDDVPDAPGLRGEDRDVRLPEILVLDLVVDGRVDLSPGGGEVIKDQLEVRVAVKAGTQTTNVHDPLDFVLLHVSFPFQKERCERSSECRGLEPRRTAFTVHPYRCCGRAVRPDLPQPRSR